MNDSTIFRPRPTIRFRVVGDEGVIVRQDSAEVVAVNEVGASVLALLDSKRTIGDVLEQLFQEYDVDPESLRTDVMRFIDELSSAGLVEEMESR